MITTQPFHLFFLFYYFLGGPPLPPGLPPPPIGTAPPLPPPDAATSLLIPQPKAMDSTLASASSVGVGNTLLNPTSANTTISNTGRSNNYNGAALSLSLEKDPKQKPTIYANQEFKKKKIKGGLTLIYDAEQEIVEEDDHGNEDAEENGNGKKQSVIIVRSMEERRSVSARYSKVMNSFWEKRKMEVQKQ